MSMVQLQQNTQQQQQKNMEANRQTDHERSSEQRLLN